MKTTTSRSNDRRGTKAERLSLRRGGPLPPRRRDDATTHELDRAGTRRDRHHVVDAPPAAPVELRQARREAGRLGDVDAVLQLPAALARPDRAPAESERESLDLLTLLTEHRRRAAADLAPGPPPSARHPNESGTAAPS